MAAREAVTFPSADAVLTALRNAAASTVPAERIEAAAAGLAVRFLDDMDDLRLGRHMLLFASFYRWLHDTMAYRFTQEEAMDLTLEQAVAKLPDGIRGRAANIVARVTEAWNECQRHYVTFVPCPRQARDGAAGHVSVAVSMI